MIKVVPESALQRRRCWFDPPDHRKSKHGDLNDVRGQRGAEFQNDW